jgi:predicted site-specific integrase-resolvase
VQEGVVSPAQAAQWLSKHGLTLSESTIKRYCDTGYLRPTVTPTGYRRIPLDELKRLLEESGVSVSAAA